MLVKILLVCGYKCWISLIQKLKKKKKKNCTMWRIWAKETNRSYLDKYKLTWITIGTDEKEPCQNLELNMKEKVNLSTIWIQVAIRIEQGLEGPIKSQCDNLIELNYCFLNLFTSTHHIYIYTHTCIPGSFWVAFLKNALCLQQHMPPCVPFPGGHNCSP